MVFILNIARYEEVKMRDVKLRLRKLLAVQEERPGQTVQALNDRCQVRQAVCSPKTDS
jgi:hypothetical protein